VLGVFFVFSVFVGVRKPAFHWIFATTDIESKKFLMVFMVEPPRMRNLAQIKRAWK
jgi:hypothetical protein